MLYTVLNSTPLSCVYTVLTLHSMNHQMIHIQLSAWSQHCMHHYTEAEHFLPWSILTFVQHHDPMHQLGVRYPQVHQQWGHQSVARSPGNSLPFMVITFHITSTSRQLLIYNILSSRWIDTPHKMPDIYCAAVGISLMYHDPVSWDLWLTLYM